MDPSSDQEYFIYRLSCGMGTVGIFFEAVMEGGEPDSMLCSSKSLFVVNFILPTFPRKTGDAH